MKFRNFIIENNKIEIKLRHDFPEVRLVMTESDDKIILNVVLIQFERRNKGEFKSFMKEVIELSNKYHKDIYLTPSDIYDADLEKLKKFYKSLGFIKNKNPKVKQDLVKHFKS